MLETLITILLFIFFSIKNNNGVKELKFCEFLPTFVYKFVIVIYEDSLILDKRIFIDYNLYEFLIYFILFILNTILYFLI